MKRATGFLLLVSCLSSLALAQDQASTPPPSATGNPAPSEAAAPASAPSTGAASGGQTTAEAMLHLRDPFKRPDLEMVKVVPKTELESYAADSFKMLGVLTGPKRLKAMLLAPDGKTYFVSEKTKIGTRGGFVRRITPEAVSVRERVVNVLGQEENLDLDLKLPEEGKKK